MSEPTNKTLQDLYAWSARLTDDWLGLGERLRRYADAWKADVDELRAEVERLAQERSTVARNPYADQNRALVAEIATRRGIVQGCPCGCRGDFYLTESDPYNVQGT